MMEENRYPRIDDEEGLDKACEPVAEAVCTRPSDGVGVVCDEIDDLDWKRLPSFGPFSDEEAIARIEQAEAELNDPTKWVTSEQMWERLHNKFPWLR